MDIYFRTDRTIIKMNDILEVNGKFLVMASLDRKAQGVLEQYSSEARAKEVLNSIDSILTRKSKDDDELIIIAIPKE